MRQRLECHPRDYVLEVNRIGREYSRWLGSERTRRFRRQSAFECAHYLYSRRADRRRRVTFRPTSLDTPYPSDDGTIPCPGSSVEPGALLREVMRRAIPPRD